MCDPVEKEMRQFKKESKNKFRVIQFGTNKAKSKPKLSPLKKLETRAPSGEEHSTRSSLELVQFLAPTWCLATRHTHADKTAI